MMKEQLLERWGQLKNAEGVDGPLVRWGVFFSLLLIAHMWIVDPYLAWRQEQVDLMQTNKRQISTLIALQNSVEKWQQALQKSEAQIAQNGEAFISAPSYALAQQKMYNLVQEQISQNLLKVESQRLQDAKSVPLGEQIELQVNLTGKMFDIINFIDALSHAPQLFNFDQLYIAVSQNQQEATIRLTLSSYRLQIGNAKSPQDAKDNPVDNPDETAVEIK
ncbi:MAG: hypothetical protein Q7U57_11695 [Methylovulum sp.]|nr:hypothetical protein [Methylovulum sp.]